MKVKDLIANLLKENQENEIWVESQDGKEALDIMEVTDGRNGSGTETFTMIVTEQSVANGDYLEPLR